MAIVANLIATPTKEMYINGNSIMSLSPIACGLNVFVVHKFNIRFVNVNDDFNGNNNN